MRKANRWILGLLALSIGVLVAVLSVNASGAAVTHGQLVDDEARRDLPVVLDGEVLAHAQIGDRIFVGGEFQQVRLQNGSVVTQPNIFAYNINTGAFDFGFRPDVNNDVRDLAVSPNGDALYVAGRFTRWNGAVQNRVTKLNANGTRDTSFNAGATAVVRSIAVTNDRVFMAGNFTSVNGASRAGFAAVNRFTGATDSGFVVNVQDPVVAELGRRIVATSDGNTVFGMHYGTRINGQTREALVKVDVSGNTATVANWRVDWSGQAGRRNCLQSLRDMAISPDDSFIVMGGQGADNPPNCDSVLRYNTGGTGVIPFTWSARMYSSVFSLAVSDVAVYVGGHFCAAPRIGAPAGGITHDPNTGPGGTANGCDTGNPNSTVNPSVRFPDQAVFRNQMAALNRNNGRALDWDPGSNNQLAVFDLTLIDRGLLAGHDRDRFSGFLVGRSGFFDFGGATPPQPPPPPPGGGGPACTVALDANNDVAVSWTGFTGAGDVQIRRNGSWLSRGAAGSSSLVDTDVSTGVSYSYVVRYRPGGTLVDVACTPASITPGGGGGTPPPPPPGGGGPACTVSLNGNNDVVIAWSGFTGVTNVQIRRDGGWISAGAAVAGSSTDTDVNPGASHSYAVRYRPGGAVVDIACSPNAIAIPGGGGAGGQGCTATTNANGSVSLSWTALAGESVYVVRRNGSWLTTVNGALSFTDTTAQAGGSYLIRSEMGGVTTNRPCA